MVGLVLSRRKLYCTYSMDNIIIHEKPCHVNYKLNGSWKLYVF